MNSTTIEVTIGVGSPWTVADQSFSVWVLDL
jgi:hypothetical protein